MALVHNLVVGTEHGTLHGVVVVVVHPDSNMSWWVFGHHVSLIIRLHEAVGDG
jgi:hypothetical protein